MFKVSTSLGHAQDDIRDTQSIFDIVCNIHGNHDFAVSCYESANKMTFGNKVTLTDGDFKVKIECYRDVLVQSINDALALVKDAICNKYHTEAVIHHTSTWTLRVICDGATSNIGYKLEYHYKDNSKGTLIVIYNNGKLRKSVEYMSIPKDVKQKILSMENKLGRKACI